MHHLYVHVLPHLLSHIPHVLSHTSCPPPHTQAASQKLSVCIGSTSSRACDNIGLPKDRTYFPDAPGIEGWVDSVLQACKEHGLSTGVPAMANLA